MQYQPSGPGAPPPPPPPPQYPYYPPPHRGPNVTAWVVVGLVALLIIGFFATLLIGFGMVAKTAFAQAEMPGERVAVVPIEGVIMSGTAGGFGSQGATAESVIGTLRALGNNGDVKAIVLRVNSPGGSAAASQEIYNEIQRVRKASGKPILVSMGDVAASGGYYISAAADEIFADPATVTGSIGVIFSGLNVRGLLGKIGIEAETITAGRLKDIGSPYRPMTPEERGLIQGLLNDVHTQFIEAVAAGRKLDVAAVRKIADGRIFTGLEAMKLGLVDKSGGLRQTVERAGQLGGIKGEPRAVIYGGGNLLDSLFGPPPELHSFLMFFNPLAASARHLLE